jgi:transposase-like protein
MDRPGPHKETSVNDNDTNGYELEEPADTTPATPLRVVRRASGSQKAKIAGALIVGGVAGAAILGPLSALAASPAPTTSSTPASGTTGSGAAGTTTDQHPGGRGGRVEATTDTSVVAKAIGISEADLLTALKGGQTVADVAKAHSVALQVVIDALIADGQAELDAAVKAGTITQTQADAQKTELTQRATDQANGSFSGGPGGRGGRVEATTDTSVVAKAIGISEADLLTALKGGQTVADVAKAHSVALQVVIDALIADGQAELDAAVKAGTITQTQADAQKTELTQRATDQANGSFSGGPGGRH